MPANGSKAGKQARAGDNEAAQEAQQAAAPAKGKAAKGGTTRRRSGASAGGEAGGRKAAAGREVGGSQATADENGTFSRSARAASTAKVAGDVNSGSRGKSGRGQQPRADRKAVATRGGNRAKRGRPATAEEEVSARLPNSFAHAQLP